MVSVPVLSKITRTDSDIRSMGRRIDDQTGTEQRTGRDHLHGRDRERQRAGTGDDQHRDGDDDRIMQRGALASQPAAVNAAAECTTGAYRRAARSARRTYRDFASTALSSRRSISSISVAVPAAVTFNVKVPEKFTLPE